MRRTIFGAAILAMMVGGGLVAAETPGAKSDEHANHHPGAGATAAAAPSSDAPAAKGSGMMGSGMMGSGMMGMMGGMCPMGGANTKVEVKKIDKGVTITMTSSDPAMAVRLQKMAEAMRLMHEASAQ
jgi:TusA-related sulfurtransferase